MRKKFICSACQRKFGTDNAGWTHIAFKHPDGADLNIQCCECNQVLNNIEDFEHHVHNHVPRDKHDRIPPKKLKDKKSPLPLPKTKPKCKSYKYFCSLCRKKFKTENLLITHVAFKHVAEAETFASQLICDSCQQVSSSLVDFKQHTPLTDPLSSNIPPSCPVPRPENDPPPSCTPPTSTRSANDPTMIKESSNKVSQVSNDLVKYSDRVNGIIVDDDDVDVVNGVVVVEDGDNDDYDDDDDVEVEKVDDQRERAEQRIENKKEEVEHREEEEVDEKEEEDDDVDYQSQIVLLSTKLTNELLNDRVDFLENKVLELKQYMTNLVSRFNEPILGTEEDITDDLLPILQNIEVEERPCSVPENGYYCSESDPPTSENGYFFSQPSSQENGHPTSEPGFYCSSPQWEPIEEECPFKDETNLDDSGDSKTRRKVIRHRALPAQEVEVGGQGVLGGLAQEARKRSKSRNSLAAA